MECEKACTKKHQEDNRAYWQELNKRAYKNWTPEYRAKRLLQSNLRHERLRGVQWDRELTELVTIEAHDKRLRLNKITNYEWHVDHIIPLNGKYVSGLHTWNNLQVIPKILNFRKSNKEMINRHI